MQRKSNHSNRTGASGRIGLYWFVGFILWSGLVIFLGWQESRAGYRMVLQLAEAEARGSFNKDLVYRRWAAKQGGLYVRSSAYTPPNPYLSHIANRDVLTPSGVELTMVNPAYMTRQVHELADRQYGVKGHITSLRPLRPENAPDRWEREALGLFERGHVDAVAQTSIDGLPYLRMMFAMKTEDFCLKCHASQGYRIGDIRGGISVSVPLTPYLEAYRVGNRSILNSKFIIWMVGSLLILVSYLATRRHLRDEQRARELLEASEEKYRRLFNDATAGFVLTDADSGAILDCNEALATMVGRSVDELIGCPQSVLYPVNFAGNGMADGFRCCRTERRGVVFPDRLATSGGRVFDVEIKAQHFRRDGRDLVFGIINDVSERVKAERVVRENEEKYRALLNSQRDSIFLHKAAVDGVSTFEEVNRAAVERYGYGRSELLRMSLTDLAAPGSFDRQQQAACFECVRKEGHCTVESCLRSKQGEEVPVEVSTTAIRLQGELYFLSIGRDITARRRAEQKQRELEGQLRQKYKMEAVGTMAGGIAHDFNNILSVIMTNLELMHRKVDKANPLLARIEQARAASVRAGNLVRQILTYSRQGEEVLQPIRLAGNIDEMLGLLRATIPATIEIRKEIGADARDVIVEADPVQIEEVLVNLCTNAVYAMGEKGVLGVRISLERLANGQLPLQPEVLTGNCFRIAVSDTGSGMAAALMEKIFDPFFTTKPEGSGTGMGLSISQGIVRRHNGCLTVESTPGRGSTFSIYLPVSGKSVEIAGGAAPGGFLGGSEALLLIDDEEALTVSVGDFFRDCGYAVTCENDSAKAVELFRNDPRRFDLVITDQTMPGKTGLDVIGDIRRVRSDLPVILCTGFSASVNRATALAAGAAEFMLKPVDLSELARAVRLALDDRRDPL